MQPLDLSSRLRRIDTGDAIRAARRNKGWTQGELGRRLCPPVSHVAVSDIERGVTKLDLERLGVIAAVFGCTLGQLLGTDIFPPSRRVLTIEDACAWQRAGRQEGVRLAASYLRQRGQEELARDMLGALGEGALDAVKGDADATT